MHPLRCTSLCCLLGQIGGKENSLAERESLTCTYWQVGMEEQGQRERGRGAELIFIK